MAIVENLDVPTEDELAAVLARGRAATVPDRNTSSIPTSTNPSAISLDQTNSPSQTTQSAVTQNSDSNAASLQLPAGAGADTSGTGIAAASTTSSDNAISYTQSTNAQLGLNNPAFNVMPSGAASPVDQAALQSSSNVYNNAYGTTSNQGDDTIDTDNQSSPDADPYDRVKLRFKPGHPFATYPGVLNPLLQTNGMVWLFKPSVQLNSTVDYETLSLTHSIQEIHAFMSNRATQISVTGQFVSQNVSEAMYALAAIQFMKTVSKMAFGTDTVSAATGLSSGVPVGSPPPVLLLSGYGPLMLNDLPVIVTSFALDLPADVDYIEVPFSPSNGTKIPVSFSLVANLTVQQSPANMRKFNLNTFAQNGQQGWW
jgi:hypothetical protein